MDKVSVHWTRSVCNGQGQLAMAHRQYPLDQVNVKWTKSMPIWTKSMINDTRIVSIEPSMSNGQSQWAMSQVQYPLDKVNAQWTKSMSNGTRTTFVGPSQCQMDKVNGQLTKSMCDGTKAMSNCRKPYNALNGSILYELEEK